MMNTLDDLIGEENPVRLIDLLVEKIIKENLDKYIKERRSEVGPPQYHPANMMKLYLYGYLNRVSSSRRLEEQTYKNIEVIWLLGNLKPDHWTISNYRKENTEEIKLMTKQFREFLKEMRYIEGKQVGIDGSKVKANAKRDMLTMAGIDKSLEQLEAKLEEYIKRLVLNDTLEDCIEESEGDGSTINKQLIEKIAELQEKVNKLETAKTEMIAEGKVRTSLADKDSRLMRTRDGKQPAYNVQIVVDSAYKMIADSEVMQDENDMELVPQMIESLEEELGIVPQELLADGGYYNPDLIEKVEKEKGINCYIPVRKSTRVKNPIEFNYDSFKDEYICSEGKPLKLKQRNKLNHNRLADVYQGYECDGCKKREICTESNVGRIFNRYHNQEYRDEFKRKMGRKSAKLKMGKRKALIEHIFGTIKCMMGKIPLLLRGKRKVEAEINLYATVYNLKRLINIEKFDLVWDKFENYNWKVA
jgi:transposase